MSSPRRSHGFPNRLAAGPREPRLLLLLLVAVIGGAFCGQAAWRGAVQRAATAAPTGWLLDPPKVPYQLTELSGTLGHEPETLSLEAFRGLRPAVGTDEQLPAALAATITLREGGQCELWSQLPPGPGVFGVLVERIGEPSTRLVTVDEAGRETMDCGPALPAPGQDPVQVSIVPTEQGVRVHVGGEERSCPLQLAASRPLVLPGLRRVHVSDLSLAGQDAPIRSAGWPSAWWLAGALLVAALVLLELATGARLALVLITTLPLLGAAALAHRDLGLWAETARVAWLPTSWLPLGLPATAALLAKLSHHLGRALREPVEPAAVARTSRWWWLAAAIPALATTVAVAWGASSPAWPLRISLALAAGLLLLPLSAGALRLLGSAHALRSSVGILGCAAATALLMACLLHPGAHPQATGWLAAAGALAALLVWANANAQRARLYNLTCLAAALLAAASCEQGVRFSPAGQAWDAAYAPPGAQDIFTHVQSAAQDFELLSAAQPTSYPDRGYPVQIQPADGRPRIVVMGGSTTGGAWQNDDLDEFYPARLAELLGPDQQVLNQGVGGWTTWHIQRYLQARLPDLAPDVLVLYVGHNDLLTPVPLPYHLLHQRWSRGGVAAGSSGFLNRFRLYQGLRYLLASLQPASRRVAVPLEQARENLAAIVAAVVGTGGHVILMSEGLAPDPGLLEGYNRMMRELASTRPAVSYLDIAGLLHEQPGAGLFLDDCHLTPSGHETLAARLYQELRNQGLASAPTSADPPADAGDPAPMR